MKKMIALLLILISCIELDSKRLDDFGPILFCDSSVFKPKVNSIFFRDYLDNLQNGLDEGEGASCKDSCCPTGDECYFFQVKNNGVQIKEAYGLACRVFGQVNQIEECRFALQSLIEKLTDKKDHTEYESILKKYNKLTEKSFELLNSFYEGYREIAKKAQSIIEAIACANNALCVFDLSHCSDVVIFYDQKFDITQEVIDRMNTEYLS
jgi:hypothetical protein